MEFCSLYRCSRINRHFEIVSSRNQENNTTKYPDIISRMPAAYVDVQTAIIDSECVAWDPEKKQILPFQVLTTRKKKDVDAKGPAYIKIMLL